MTLRRSHVVLSSFVGLIAWGLVARWFPVAKFLVASFLLGFAAAIALLLLVLLSTARTPNGPGTGKRVVPAFVAPTGWHLEKTWYSENVADKSPRPIFRSSDVSSAVDELLNLALQDYIKSWYHNISQSPLFVNQVGWNIRYALAELKEKIMQEDILSVIVSRILPILTAHLKDFDTADHAVRGRGNRSLTDSDELNMVIASNYRDGKLHPAAALAYADSRSIQQDHVRRILVRVLPQLLPQSVTRSRAVAVLVKEIVACAVVFPMLQLLSDPDTWNQMIEAYGRATLQDRRNVKRMRAALDEHATPHTKALPANEIPKLSPNDSERSFERFVRAIRKVRTLADARRFRSQIASQLAKARTNPDQDATYIRRLEMGKRVLDQKITKMTQVENGDVIAAAAKTTPGQSKLPALELPLTEIMHTASGLSYFMEFMDRQRKMALVQFWVVVDGFRNPLEDDFGDDTSVPSSTWTNNDRLDISQISEAHLSKAELNIPQESQEAVQSFLVAGRNATSEQYRAARTAILSAQSAVLDELETTYLPLFRKSDLYYSFLASGEAAAKARQMLPASTERAASPVLGRSIAPPPQMSRNLSQPNAHKSRDLRRAALSSSDVKGLSASKMSDASETPRRSFEGEYRPLFDDDLDNDPLASSVTSLGHDSTNGDLAFQNDVIENMEAAMTDIMTQSPLTGTSDTEHDALFGSPISTKAHSATADRPRDIFEQFPTDTQGAEKAKPSLATLGLVNTSSRIGVFQDNDLFGDEEKFAEDEYADEDDAMKKLADDEIHEAAPGDLGLTEAISALTAEIERLVSQDSVVDTLTRKAELTNNTAELRILGKSKASLQREIRRKELQRQQYIVQESDNSLYGRASINIKSIMVGREDNGQEFAMYVIEVRRQSAEQMPAATWTITKRYSEFHELHQKLRRRYPSTRNLEFPRRRMVMKLQKQFLHNRRVALEAYLRHLLRMPDVCRSRELRSFLSQQAISSDAKAIDPTANTQDIVSRIYESVTDGMDEFLGNIAVIDQLSTAGQNLISAAAATAPTKTTGTEIINIEPAAGSVAEAEAELRAFEDKELEPFVKPICDIFLETFELNRGNNWLRGRAVVVVLHQLLGGTVERKIREIFRSFFVDDALIRYIQLAKDTMWPVSMNEDGSTGKREMRQQPAPRTSQQKARSRDQAADILGNLIPDLTSSVTGRANAQTAARRIMAAMNNRRLNEHLVFTLLDEFVSVLFGPTTNRRPHVT